MRQETDFPEKRAGTRPSRPPPTPVWLNNLRICTLVSFVVSVGMSQMAPILPLYIHELGVHDEAGLARWSGIVFGCNFISLAIFAPIWGMLADRYGCKPMVLRACAGLALCMALIGMARSVGQLAALRLMQGTLSGFVGAVIALVMTQAPKERGGWAMGVLISGMVGGNLVGPLVGGILSRALGLRGNFLFMSGCACCAFFLVLFLVREDFRPRPETAGRGFALTRPLAALFCTSFVSQFALMCMTPVLTVYIRAMRPESEHIALISGAVFAATALPTALFGPAIGRFLDSRGPARTLPLLLAAAALLCPPQALAGDPWTLAALRFLFGAAAAGMLPAVNTLLRDQAPEGGFSRVSGVNFSFQTLGIFAGSLAGGQAAAHFGPASVFWLAALILGMNAAAFRRVFPRGNG